MGDLEVFAFLIRPHALKKMFKYIQSIMSVDQIKQGNLIGVTAEYPTTRKLYIIHSAAT